MYHAWGRNGRCARYDCDQKYQTTTLARLALRFLVPSRGALPGNSFLAFSFRSWLAQCRPFRLRSTIALSIDDQPQRGRLQRATKTDFVPKGSLARASIYMGQDN